MRVLLVYALLAVAAHQVAAECKNCVVNKAGRAVFRAHSAACLPQSGAEPRAVAALLRGQALDSPALRRHVYCVLRACKLVGKDGRLLKAALARTNGAGGSAAKVLERCSEQAGDSPEKLAWQLFRCTYNSKAALLDTLHHDE